MYFGGKSKVASVIWQRFGDAPHFIDPFFGSNAVLLNRPHKPQVETINDIDCFVSNFWRAVKYAPDEVAKWAIAPVSEVDLHAIHRYLVMGPDTEDFAKQMRLDPEYYNAKFAGWWIYGINLWIGTGWCTEALTSKLPFIAGRGRALVNSYHAYHAQGKDCSEKQGGGDEQLIHDLSERMKHVRVCCGDWPRILGDATIGFKSPCAILLDPPYTQEGRCRTYKNDTADIAQEVRDWAVAHGDDKSLRIAYCGYEGMDFPKTWEKYEWKANGGYGNQGEAQGRENARKERIWFSPHCLTTSLFDFEEEVQNDTD